MKTDDQDPLFQEFLKDFGLEHLNADERGALRRYLTHLGRKRAEFEVINTTIRPEDHAAFLRALDDAEPTEDLVALLKLHSASKPEVDHDVRRAIRTSETPDDVKPILFEALEQPYEP